MLFLLQCTKFYHCCTHIQEFELGNQINFFFCYIYICIYSWKINYEDSVKQYIVLIMLAWAFWDDKMPVGLQVLHCCAHVKLTHVIADQEKLAITSFLVQYNWFCLPLVLCSLGCVWLPSTIKFHALVLIMACVKLWHSDTVLTNWWRCCDRRFSHSRM